MGHIGNKIKQLIEQKKISIEQVAVWMDKSRTAIYNDFKMSELNTSVLKQYSKILSVPITYWFDEDTIILNEAKPEYLTQVEAENKLLKRQIETLQDLVETKEFLIKRLLKENSGE